MRLVLLGGPGAGKGTQAVMLAKKLNIPHISTGDIFRANIKNGTELGKMAKAYIDRGALVPDELTVNIVKERLQKEDCKNGFILDGFPRTIPQAKYLEKALESLNLRLDVVLNIAAEDDVIVKRLSGRRLCPACGAGYHIKSCPPKENEICDCCNSGIVQRDDDREETIVKRLKTYHDQTEPLVEYYGKKGNLRTVSGSGRIEDTFNEIIEVLGFS